MDIHQRMYKMVWIKRIRVLIIVLLDYENYEETYISILYFSLIYKLKFSIIVNTTRFQAHKMSLISKFQKNNIHFHFLVLDTTISYLNISPFPHPTESKVVHYHLIEKAKEILFTTNLSVAEIAHRLGFEYPQIFSKLFKSKINLTPINIRQSFN